MLEHFLISSLDDASMVLMLVCFSINISNTKKQHHCHRSYAAMARIRSYSYLATTHVAIVDLDETYGDYEAAVNKIVFTISSESDVSAPPRTTSERQNRDPLTGPQITVLTLSNRVL